MFTPISIGAIWAAWPREVQKIIANTKVPKTSEITLRGQAATMQSSFYRLGLGLLAAIVLVYLLMAVNFQSWVDPFIILTALPGAWPASCGCCLRRRRR